MPRSNGQASRSSKPTLASTSFNIGGHAYGDIDPGPVGAVVTPGCAVFGIGQTCQAQAPFAARAVTCVQFVWTFRGCCFICVTTPHGPIRRGGYAGRCAGSG